MKNRDTISLVGHVTIQVLDGVTGRELRRVSTKNLVVNGAKNVIATQLCSGTFSTSYRIHGIGAGNSTAAPSLLDTDLIGAKTFKKKYSSRTFTSDGIITLEVTFGTSEGNVLGAGEYFTEAGLFVRGGAEWTAIPPETAPSYMVMLARQVHAPVPKTVSNSLKYTWTLSILPS
jgi:hypothetical protein